MKSLQAQLLDKNYKRFVDNLSAYKPSSGASLEKVRSGKVELGGKVQAINASEREFVAKLSKRLVHKLPVLCICKTRTHQARRAAVMQDLDAVEALKIFRNFMKYEATGRFEYDAETSLREVRSFSQRSTGLRASSSACCMPGLRFLHNLVLQRSCGTTTASGKRCSSASQPSSASPWQTKITPLSKMLNSG